MPALLLIFLLFLFVPQISASVTNRFSASDDWPALGERYFFITSSSQGLHRHQVGLHLSNALALRSIDIFNAKGARLGSTLDYYLSHTLSAAFGITDFWQAGFSLPLYSRARFQDLTVTPLPTSQGVSDVGDLRLATRLRLLDGNRHRFGAGLEPFLTIPLGADRHFLGDSSVTGGFRAIGDFPIADRIRLALNLGAEFRKDSVLIGDVNFRNRFLGNLGLSADLGHGLTLSAEAQANSALRNFFSKRNTTPIEFLGGVRWAVGKTGFAIGIGGGTCGICGGKAAKARAFLDVGYQSPPRPQSLKETREIEEEKHELPAVHFGFNQTQIRKEARRILRQIADLIRHHPQTRSLKVIGHTDSTGKAKANRRVSMKRAKNVVHYLRSHGVPRSVRLIPIGRGASQPAASNRTREGRRANRRVTFEKSRRAAD